MNLGEKIKNIRKMNKVSQQGLADMLKVSLPTIRKWENNEVVPKKGEITKLCKKLNCTRSDLGLEEIKVLKEEPKSEEQKENLVLKEEEKKEEPKPENPLPITNEKQKEEEIPSFTKHDRSLMRGFSKATQIIAIIIHIACLVAIPCLLIVMFLLPILSSKIVVKDNTISITDTNEKITLHDDDSGAWLDINGERIVASDKIESYGITFVREFLKNNSVERIVWHLEVILIIGTVSLAIIYYVLRNIEKFFKNIYQENIFNKDNQKYLGLCAWLLILLIILENASSFTLSSMLKTDYMPKLNLIYIMLILSLFALKYVFKYAKTLEKEDVNNLQSQD